LAALGTLLISVILLILPFALVYQQLQSAEIDSGRFFGGVFPELPDWLVSLFGHFGLGDFATIQRKNDCIESEAMSGRCVLVKT